MNAMDGSLHHVAPHFDVSAVAGRITAILAQRHALAERDGDAALASRYDVGLDTIYYAALLLMIVEGSGETRSRAEALAALDAVAEVTSDLRAWVAGLAS